MATTDPSDKLLRNVEVRLGEFQSSYIPSIPLVWKTVTVTNQPSPSDIVQPTPSQHMGWICPKCGAVNAPTVLRCPCTPHRTWGNPPVQFYVNPPTET